MEIIEKRNCKIGKILFYSWLSSSERVKKITTANFFENLLSDQNLIGYGVVYRICGDWQKITYSWLLQLLSLKVRDGMGLLPYLSVFV